MPSAIATLAHEMLKNPVTLNLARKAAPAVGITQAVYPVPQDLKTSLLVKLLNHGQMNQALVFTRTKHRANRLADQLGKQKINVARIHGNRSQAQRTDALEASRTALPRPRRHRHRGARHRRRGARPRRQLDVPLVPRLHPPRRPHGAGGDDGRRLHVRGPRRESDLRAIEQAIGKRRLA
jgi:ATP-dependent RNA helicase RhlE